MLVLTRKKGESIMIGDSIELVVIGVEGDLVKLGIRAPKSVEVYRKELYDSIQSSNKEATERSVLAQDLSAFFKKDK
ncbi:carbon storage regulator CsrA [Paenibacillus mesophilus]|uniref:carbon storage regulator CsrA n=1 Tax=Paenibacillus mesophilus TaxID=2582849 RepID=UPI00110D8EE8|nr:carbon storage regulator CsrA [Paenibacillus mesophilus]TMV47174.1 carbon storage regulator CsrA [Paenibacillus mesophilus]